MRVTSLIARPMRRVPTSMPIARTVLYSHPSPAHITVKHACLVALSIFVTACTGQRTPQYHQKLVVLGFDGLDPDLVSQFMDEGKLPNMQKLSRQGALQRLETTPSADVSAWASFATGTNPGKHGVFGGDATPERHGAPFWTLAGRGRRPQFGADGAAHVSP